MRAPLHPQPQRLAMRAETLAQDAQVAIGAGPHPDHRLLQHPRQPRAIRIIGVDHRRRVGRQEAGEQPGLGLEIGLHRGVVIEMVLREIGEPRRRQPHPIQPPLVQPMRRGLHRAVRHARRRGLGQEALEGDRIGRGVAERRAPGAFDPRGADIDRRMAHRHPQLPRETGDRGLAVGAGDRDHRGGLGAKEQRRRHGQRGPGVLRHDQRDRRMPGQRLGGQGGAGGIGQDGTGAHSQGRVDELGAVHPAAGQGCEQGAGAHRAAVEGDRAEAHRAVAGPCRQSQICEALAGHRFPLPLPAAD